MGKSIYTYYKERLVEIGGGNKCLYLRGIVRRNSYDIGRIFEGRDDKVSELVSFLWRSSKSYVLPLITKNERDAIVGNIKPKKHGESTEGIEYDDAPRKSDKSRLAVANKILEGEVIKVKELRREADEMERERGKCELYIGYPFVFGCVNQAGAKTLIKAPLLLFPVKLEISDEHTVDIRLNTAEKVRINQALVFAYAQSRRLKIENLELEFDDIRNRFKSVDEVVAYLNDAGIKIGGQMSSNILSYSRFKEPEMKSELSLRAAAVLGRFKLSNDIYSDYSTLERRNLTNDALTELLRMGKPKKKFTFSIFRRAKKKPEPLPSYSVKALDYAQSRVLSKVEDSGNVVIYGPPGTGKSQTIVNIIADAIIKGRRVLVVSQKRAALDVVYNRLGRLADRTMYITDESRERTTFYARAHAAHERDRGESPATLAALEAEYGELNGKIAEERRKLDEIYALLTDVRQPFGMSLADMYANSYNLSKNSGEYAVYTELIKDSEVMAMSHKELTDAMFGIGEAKLGETYYRFMQSKEKNPLIDLMRDDIDIRTISEVKSQLEVIQRTKKGLFNTAKYPYYRQVLAFYRLLDDDASLDKIVRLEAGFQKPGFFARAKLEREIKEEFLLTLEAIRAFVKEYECLNLVLTPDGYLAVIDNVLRGNLSYVKLVHDALDNYISIRDVSHLLDTLDGGKSAILNFAYNISKNYQNYLDILAKLPTIRIYHEVLKYEEMFKDSLGQTLEFEDITERIYRLSERELEVAAGICAERGNREYEELYRDAPDNKDYLYQISKKQKFWPIRKMMEVYGEYILTLFPCWLLSPENVSSLLPLTKNLFDLVIFDEASQIFIENTIPTIYRGKTIVVAGDDKQLRPSATFMKRYLGADPEAEEDYSMQAALEVDSLLDLAVARYESANLTYHYRSKSQELIDFSNAAFYNSGLQVAPNITKNSGDHPIVRHMVNGKWVDRRNPVEAARVVEILKDIFKTRKNGESIGIITFNSEQQSEIADMIDKESLKDEEFRSNMLRESHRVKNGEDESIFVKNLENVQGDERDIIIFSIGYAKNEAGKVHTAFGSLSAEGGENRLNVAITRAKTKIIVVTSIEPEELKVEETKHLGPKLLQKYLQYVRAVSDGNTDEVKAILSDISSPDVVRSTSFVSDYKVEEEIKAKLEKMGYTVETMLGTKNNIISLAVYDKDVDRYLVGIELDKDAFLSSASSMERDVYKPRFLRDRGWDIVRVWCRDWWISPQKVIKNITQIIERNKKKKS